MHAENPVPIFFAIMTIILFAPMVSEYLRLPGVVGLIIAGMVIGPYGVKLLKETGIVESLATIGLIYLMFGAGLEVNLQQLARVRNKAVVFGILTFSVPFVMGLLLGRWIGLDWLGAVLLGSAVSSHTLLALPVVTRLGIMANSSVAVTVGATVFTDITAFLVLAIITGMKSGDTSLGGFVVLVMMVLLYAALILLTLPRIGKWFFRHFSSTLVEFQFILVVLFVAALLAEAIGMHGVVGAFLAGLAINSTLPHHSPVLGRILFIGESLFIPVFLIHSGMITNGTAFFSDAATLGIGLALTGVAYVSKFGAAWLTAKLFGYSRAEMMTMFGLSQAQAAVTLPTILVGMQIGLFPDVIFAATMMMILATSFTSPLIVRHFGASLGAAEPEKKEAPRSVFDRIVVSVFNPHTQDSLLTLASILAKAKHGTMYVLRVAQAVGGRVRDHNEIQHIGVEHLQEDNFTCLPVTRVDSKPAEGILHTAIEKDATLLILGWRGKASFRQSVFGTVLDEVVWKANLPVMVVRLTMPVGGLQHVTLVMTPNSIPPSIADETYEIARVIAHALNVPLTVVAHRTYVAALHEYLKQERIEHPKAHEGDQIPIVELALDVERDIHERAKATELIMITTTGSCQRFQSSLGKIPEHLANETNASMAVIYYPS